MRCPIRVCAEKVIKQEQEHSARAREIIRKRRKHSNSIEDFQEKVLEDMRIDGVPAEFIVSSPKSPINDIQMARYLRKNNIYELEAYLNTLTPSRKNMIQLIISWTEII